MTGNPADNNITTFRARLFSGVRNPDSGSRFHRGRRLRQRSHSGISQVEVLLSLLLLAFLVSGTAALLNAGLRQQRLARGYSNDQTDLRNALRLATRAIRHSTGVINSSGVNFGSTGVAEVSNASVLFVTVPEPSPGTNIQHRYYLSGGTLYRQRSSDTGPGTPLLTNVTGLQFNYYRTLAGLRTSADPGNATGLSTSQATEVLITVTVSQEYTTTKATALVYLRNYSPGF